jgi:hypothetical protein
MYWKLGCIFWLFACLSQSGYAQGIYKGIVADSATLQPLPDVNIRIKDRNVGVVSDAKGYFSIQAKESDTVIISMVGYVTKVYPVRELRESMIVYLTEQFTMLRPVVIDADILIPGQMKIPKQSAWRNPTYGPGTQTTPGAPVIQSFGPGYVFSGAFSRFSKEEKEKRKLVRVQKANERAKGYVAIVNSPEVKGELMKDYKLNEDAYYKLLADFNEKNKDIIYELGDDELISLIFIFFGENFKK